MRPPARRGALAATGVVGALLTFATPATAHERPPVVGVVVTGDDDAAPGLQVADLYPTASRTVVYFLEGPDRSVARRAALTVSDVVDVENGCNRPESASGDTTCRASDGEGELSGFLTVAAAAGRRDGTAGCAPGTATTTPRPLADLHADPLVVGLPDRDGELCVLLTVAHREADGDNVTQSDRVRFALGMAVDDRTVALPASSSDRPGGLPASGPGSTPGTVVVDGFGEGDVVALTASGAPDGPGAAWGAALAVAALLGGAVVVTARRLRAVVAR